MMKNILTISVLALLVGLAGCKKDEVKPSESELAHKAISHEWVVANGGSVMVDGQDISADYSNFSIKFSVGDEVNTYSVKNGGYAFPVSIDTWSFVNDNFVKIQRGSDGIEMDVDMSTEDKLMLSFTTPEPTGGRIDGLFGNFEFMLIKLEN